MRNALIAIVMLGGAVSALADEKPWVCHTGTESGKAGQVGTVNFAISCNAVATQQFQCGVATLHSFWYEEARETFKAAAKSDPKCGIASWGLAMSFYHPLWNPPEPEELKQGQAAIEQARAAGAKTPREREYIEAIASFYKDAGKVDHRTRVLAYEKAMAELAARHPDDQEAQIFYALSLLGTALPTDKTYANQAKAGAILEKAFEKSPNHPGIAHYLIHSYDYPPLATKALDAARRYAKIAPSVAHALHMPSHIFTRLALWQEAVDSNRASAATARAYAEKKKPGSTSFEELHALDYLEYAYLQMGQGREAKAVLDRVADIAKLQSSNFAAGYAFTAVPARYTIELRRWKEAASLELHPADYPWERHRWAESNLWFARALGAARSGQPARAKQDVAKLEEIRSVLAKAKEPYWTGEVENQARMARAWIALAEGDKKTAEALMKQAADAEDATEKHPVTPAPIVPARELYADMLMELGQPAAALANYDQSLARSPGRFAALAGAARSALRAGKKDQTRERYAKLVALAARGDDSRPELSEARAFLGKK